MSKIGESSREKMRKMLAIPLLVDTIAIDSLVITLINRRLFTTQQINMKIKKKLR
jgi:hypothetical protein